MQTGTVTRVELEGGFFGIIADGGEQLYPLDLPQEFQKDGLRVTFQAKDSDTFTLQMWGRTVNVTNVAIGD